MNKKRRLAAGITAMLICIAITGCGSELSLNDEQNELIAEYAANSVLQNNPEYEDRLEAVTESTTAEVIATTQSIATTEDVTKDTSGNVTVDTDTSSESTTEELPKVTDISNLFSNQKLSVKYNGYEIADYYNDKNEASSSIEASGGNKLLIVKFTMKNKAASKTKADMLDSTFSYTLHTDIGDVEPMLTLLEDDLAVYQGNLISGACKDLVLLFELPKQSVKEVDFSLDVSNGQETSSIAIQ